MQRLARQRLEAEKAAFLHHFVVAIQRNFRGYRSRRFTHDYYARKAYIKNVGEKSEAIRAEAAELRDKQIKVGGDSLRAILWPVGVLAKRNGWDWDGSYRL